MGIRSSWHHNHVQLASQSNFPCKQRSWNQLLSMRKHLCTHKTLPTCPSTLRIQHHVSTTTKLMPETHCHCTAAPTRVLARCFVSCLHSSAAPAQRLCLLSAPHVNQAQKRAFLFCSSSVKSSSFMCAATMKSFSVRPPAATQTHINGALLARYNCALQCTACRYTCVGPAFQATCMVSAGIYVAAGWPCPLCPTRSCSVAPPFAL